MYSAINKRKCQIISIKDRNQKPIWLLRWMLGARKSELIAIIYSIGTKKSGISLIWFWLSVLTWKKKHWKQWGEASREKNSENIDRRVETDDCDINRNWKQWHRTVFVAGKRNQICSMLPFIHSFTHSLTLSFIRSYTHPFFFMLNMLYPFHFHPFSSKF